MTRRLLLPALATVFALGSLAAFGYTRFVAPGAPGAPGDPAIEAPYACTTCDARQAAKKRLSDHLRSQTD